MSPLRSIQRHPATLVLVCLSVLVLVIVFVDHRAPRHFVGQAQLVRDGTFADSPWQISADLRGEPMLARTLAAATGHDPVEFKGNKLVALGPERVVPQELPASPRPAGQDPLLPGGPRVAYEWKQGAATIQGTLFQHGHSHHIYSGRVRVMLPLDGLRPRPPGKPLDLLDALPADTERVALVDLEGLQLPPGYRYPLEKAWAKWEFYPLRDWGTVIGPTALYALRNGHHYLALELKDLEETEAIIEKRFPRSLIQREVDWSYGTRIFSLGKDGPAWMMRADRLYATPEGGTEPLAELLKARLEPDPGLQRQAFQEEIKRLAGSQNGWHLFAMEQRPDAPFRWAVMLSWPTSTSHLAEGFLVLDLVEPESR